MPATNPTSVPISAGSGSPISSDYVPDPNGSTPGTAAPSLYAQRVKSQTGIPGQATDVSILSPQPVFNKAQFQLLQSVLVELQVISQLLAQQSSPFVDLDAMRSDAIGNLDPSNL
jgi:hypothetical protein